MKTFHPAKQACRVKNRPLEIVVELAKAQQHTAFETYVRVLNLFPHNAKSVITHEFNLAVGGHAANLDGVLPDLKQVGG